MRIKFDEYVADFETTVNEDQNTQEDTEVWAAALCKIGSLNRKESVLICGSISAFMERIDLLLKKSNIKIYFHNLKFDGCFIMYWLLSNKKFKPYGHINGDGKLELFKDIEKMPSGSYTYSISSKGIWYTITIKSHGHICQIVDSLKLLPFTVKKIGDDFKLEHRKLEMNYIGERHANCKRTEEEDKYIANDVLVVKEALEFMHDQGHDELTIGACCLSEFAQYYDKNGWKYFFPDLYSMENEDFNTVKYGANSVGEYIRKSYKGGWCYVMPSKVNKKFYHGTTCDVNSLYPSMMHSNSGNVYPVGLPTFWDGDYIPEEAKAEDKYFFIRVKTRFRLKKGFLPCIQIKNDPLYHPREWLETSDYIIKGRRYSQIETEDGYIQARPTLTLTMTDWKLICDHYELYDTEILDGCYFNTVIGLFDDYINKYAEIKMNAKGAMRQLAKLFLNNLYGKFATSTDSSYQVLYLNDEGEIRSYIIEEEEKKPGYIPIGSAITSYARNFTIRAAQKNFAHFIYADTDSIHCDCGPDEIVGCPEDPVRFNHWKYEACWDEAIFVRQKTYAEHITHEDRVSVEKPYWSLRCAGMPERAKANFIHSIEKDLKQEEYDKLTKEEQNFYGDLKNPTYRTIEDFKIGLKVPGSLKSKRIRGGVLLVSGDYVMRPRII